MAGVFIRSDKRFSIDDAFEEENDEAIKVYGSTTERSPLKPKNRTLTDESIIVQIDDPSHRSHTTKLTFADDVGIYFRPMFGNVISMLGLNLTTEIYSLETPVSL